ncbi:alpha/beta-hydrolase [Pholiota molesta]|nr:alpha/beta-hydrolase [Pholiota molesta]
MTHTNLDYGPGLFDLYPGPNHAPVIVFVHGGAWRSEDKSDHADLARTLVAATGCHVAVPNYRLTPPENADPNLRHPVHAADIRAFLNFLCAWTHSPVPLDTKRLLLLGHSCSAHMLCSILLESHEPMLVPTLDVLRAVKGAVMSEGIYDLDILLAHFPAYRQWFVEPAFGPPHPDYARFSTLAYPLRDEAQISWFLLHSKGDTLVDIAQTEHMHAHLAALDPQHVSLNVDDLIEEHNDTLRSERYVQLVRQFAQQVFDL